VEFTLFAYQNGLSERRITASRCEGCGALYLPPRPLCPTCQTQNMSWTELSGEGTVIGSSSIAIVPSAMAAKGFGRDRPYIAGVVLLKEGPSVTARIELPDGEASDPTVDVGTRVKADFLEETDGDRRGVTLVFRPD
jgi:uncharacterized OB-fold protein